MRYVQILTEILARYATEKTAGFLMRIVFHLSAGAVLALAALAPGTVGEAASPLSVSSLQGVYGVALNATCIVSLLPFDRSGQPTNPDLSFTGTRSIIGTFNFAGDGSGSAKFRALTVVGQPTPGTAAEQDSGNFTYTVQGNVVSITLSNATISYATGPEAGLTGTVDRLRFTGRASATGNNLAIGEDEPLVETVTLSDGSAFFSICESAGSLTKL